MRIIPGLDFLRGISILVVMAYHFEFSRLMSRAGWAGVEMFFVISGFLIAGLLLNEYKQTQRINPVYFLIRRGLKIYPLFYFAVLFHLLYFYLKQVPFTSSQLLAEIFFFQNYSPGIIGISWSLAVEEHFYFLLALLLFIAYKKNLITRKLVIPLCTLGICCGCLFLRIYVYNPADYNLYWNYFPTHLRIDSIAFGVLLSYWFAYNQVGFFLFFEKNIIALLILAVFLITPVFIWERQTFFISTIGHTFLYLGFGIILSSMIVFSKTIDNILKMTRLTFLFNSIAWIGIYCFGIYLFHLRIGFMASNWVRVHLISSLPRTGYFIIYLGANIAAGVFFTWLIERPFLNLRTKYFPGPSGVKITERSK